MFHLFGKKKETGVVIKDKIWISKIFKWHACLNEIQKNKNTIVVLWFDNTYEELKTFLSENNISGENILMSRELSHHYILNNQIIFAEHYPLILKEEELYKKLGLFNITVYSSLDEPLFLHFGGEKIIGLVKQLGMKEDEPIEHAFITASIKNAQEKIAETIVVEQSANSQADWFLKNLTHKQL